MTAENTDAAQSGSQKHPEQRLVVKAPRRIVSPRPLTLQRQPPAVVKGGRFSGVVLGRPNPPEPGPSKAADANAATGPVRRKVDRWLSARYRIEAEINRGGSAKVYLATDNLLNMPVAIKILNVRFNRDRAAVESLKREARLAMGLSHSHIVRLHNLQRASSLYFLVMEFVEGQTVEEVLKDRGPQPLQTVARVVAVCADAIAYAHRHGVLHNDLKPGNLMVGRDGVLKIIDFGIASLLGERSKGRWIEGTPPYMSPEQMRGESLDGRTDVYALAVIACEMLAGRPPFPDDFEKAMQLKATPPRMTALPAPIAGVLEKAMAPDRTERWESVDAFSAAFAQAVAQSGGS